MCLAASLVTAVATSTLAQQPVPAPTVAAVAPPAPGFVRIPAGIDVDIEVATQITSKTAKIDAEFPIRLAAPIIVDGVTLVPAGVTGIGQVVHAAKARAMGKPGELILAARTLGCGPVTVPLRAFRLNGQGTNRAGLVVAAGAAAGMFAAPLMFLSGGEVVIPEGTHALAKVKAVVDVPAAGCSLTGLPLGATTPAAAAGAAY